MTNTDEQANDCPNCYGDDRSTGCLHLRAGDTCPNCGRELTKPPAGKVECERCQYVVNGQRNGIVGSDFHLTEREAKRFLDLFGYDTGGSLGTLESRLWKLCADYDIEPQRLGDVLQDLTGRYVQEPESQGDPEVRADGGTPLD